MFDTITSIAVLEHIRDLEGFFSIMLSHLRKGGKIFIVVPAVEGFERYYQHKANYFNHEHINYFSKISLNNILKKYGCKSMTDTQGEFYISENNSGTKDLVLQDMFCYEGDAKCQQNRDTISKKSITGFLKNYKKEEQRINEISGILAKEDKECIVWGAGSLSMQLMSNEKFAEKVAFFVDNKEKVGKDIAGKRIYAPDILENRQYSDLLILVVCMQHSDDIVRQINERKIENGVLIY